jgi:site-specific DNA recombinase
MSDICAAGYVRVSTQEQARHGWNLEEDRQLIRELCERKGWELGEINDDGGRQGDDPDRPGLLRMLAELDRYDVIVLRDMDRLARDTYIHALVTRELKAAGVRVETFRGPVDLQTPHGEFQADILAAVGKFEKKLIGLRVKQAMQARARSNTV